MTAGDRVIVIGVGNPWRGDDGAGPAVAAAVAHRMGDRVEVTQLDGEAARLVEAWDGADVAVVVDAVRTGVAPGTVVRLDVGEIRALARHLSGTTSSHGLGVAQAVELGRVLDRLPRRLILVGIGGADFGSGRDLSAAVAAAVDPATGIVADLVAGLVEERA